MCWTKHAKLKMAAVNSVGVSDWGGSFRGVYWLHSGLVSPESDSILNEAQLKIHLSDMLRRSIRRYNSIHTMTRMHRLIVKRKKRRLRASFAA